MTYQIVYSFCMLISSMVEVYMAFDFYRAFHPVTPFFEKTGKQLLVGAIIVGINFSVNLQNNNLLNTLCLLCLYFFLSLFVFCGNIWSRLFHWFMFVFVGAGSEMIFVFLLQLSTSRFSNTIFKSEFVMISSVIAAKLLQFTILTGIKQISRICVNKVSAKIFGVFIIIPVATFGLTFTIPYVRGTGEELTGMDIVLLLFYVLLLVGNVCLFYVFTKYSQMKEEQTLQKLAQIRYEERKQKSEQMVEREKEYKEQIHNIKYYLQQIGIYLESREYDKIEELLQDLHIEVRKEDEKVICYNSFLNALLLDFDEKAKKQGIQMKNFVEAGFKIEYMREIDISTMLGNLLDNAIEAAAKCSHGEIRVDLFMANEGAFALFRIINNYQGEIKKQGRKLISTKVDGGLHGIGIQSVEKVVEKYGGYMLQEFEEGRCVSSVILPMESQKNAKIDL